MRKIILFTFLTTISFGAIAQNDQSLSDQLWHRVAPCYAMFEDSNDDGEVDYEELIDDSNNGYLKVAGFYPTCGCYCENTVGAFKTSANKYIFLQKSIWSCSWHIEVSSSDSLKEIFPFDFEKDGFFGNKPVDPEKMATFYLDFDIPQKGTDTKVTINTIPFGLNIPNDNSIVCKMSEETSRDSLVSYYGISIIAHQIENEKTLEYILNDQFSMIPASDQMIVNKQIGGNSDNFKNEDELIQRLHALKRKYDQYSQIKHQWIVLGWDRDKSSFYIKEKGTKPEPVTFLEFLMNTKTWGYSC